MLLKFQSLWVNNIKIKPQIKNTLPILLTGCFDSNNLETILQTGCNFFEVVCIA